jgi:hypothetical protein
MIPLPHFMRTRQLKLQFLRALLAAAAGAGAAVLAAHGATMIEAGGARAPARLVRVTPLQEG